MAHPTPVNLGRVDSLGLLLGLILFFEKFCSLILPFSSISSFLSLAR